MNLERIYKESNIEKWVFSVNGNVVKNFVIVRFNGSTTMDIVLSDDYRHLEKQIVRELLKSLGINEDKECFYGVYFYTKKRNYLIEDEISSSIKTKLDSE
jgi:sulfur carrier protein ThiS